MRGWDGGKQRQGRESEHLLPEHPSEEGSGRFDLLVGFSHQLHGLLFFTGVVHVKLGLSLAERWEENGPMFRRGRRRQRCLSWRCCRCSEEDTRLRLGSSSKAIQKSHVELTVAICRKQEERQKSWKENGKSQQEKHILKMAMDVRHPGIYYYTAIYI